MDMFTSYGHIKKRKYNFGHVHILWTYQEAKIQFWRLDIFWPDCVTSMWHN